jgi:hypothetical protein
LIFPDPSKPGAGTHPIPVNSQPSPVAEDTPDPAVEREIFEYGIRGLPLENSTEEPMETPQIVQLEGRATVMSSGRAALSLETGVATKKGMAAGARRTFEQQVPPNIGEVRNATRAFVKAIDEELERLRASTPNDPEQLERHREFVSFLEMLSRGLTNLATTLDNAVKAAGTKNERAFLGKAGDIVEQLSIGVMEWLTKNRAHVAGYTVRIGLVAAGWTFLHWCGMGGITAAFVSSVVNASIPKQKSEKKRPAKGRQRRRVR